MRCKPVTISDAETGRYIKAVVREDMSVVITEAGKRCKCGRYKADGKPCHCAGIAERVRYTVGRWIARRRARRIANRMRRAAYHG